MIVFLLFQEQSLDVLIIMIFQCRRLLDELTIRYDIDIDIDIDTKYIDISKLHHYSVRKCVCVCVCSIA